MKSPLTSVAVLAIVATMLMTPAISQTSGSGPANAPTTAGPGAAPGPHGWGRGMMMGPGMMGMGGMAAMCDPRGAGLAEWRMERIERLVNRRSSLQPARANCLPALPGDLS